MAFALFSIPRRLSRNAVLALGVAFGLAPVLGSPAVAGSVTVFAAASTKTAMDEIVAGFAEQTGDPVAVSLAGSSALARQIQRGAPADIFISANADWMDRLQADGLIDTGTRTDLLGNTLVLIAHGAAARAVQIAPGLDLVGMLDGGKLAMALVEAVPAGQYGKAALQSLGLWDGVAPHVAQADNVRAALAFVSSGAAPLGIVYATDAVADPRVIVIGIFAADSHPPIVYPAAVLAGRATPAVLAFFAYLRSPVAAAAFARQGFSVAGG